MKLQIALDGSLQDSLEILKAVRPYVDIAEIGTPLIYRDGMIAVRRLRKIFPDLLLLADLKIMDAGEEEATIAFEAGCDIVTVLGVTQNATLHSALKAAHYFKKQVMVDMMQVPDLNSRASTLLAMGCHYLCVHTAYDLQATHNIPLSNIRQLQRELADPPLAVAGGIGPDTIDSVANLNPEIIIVGGAITRSPDPVNAARSIRERMNTS